MLLADLVAAAVNKSTGAAVHWREGSPHRGIATWLIAGSSGWSATDVRSCAQVVINRSPRASSTAER